MWYIVALAAVTVKARCSGQLLRATLKFGGRAEGCKQKLKSVVGAVDGATTKGENVVARKLLATLLKQACPEPESPRLRRARTGALGDTPPRGGGEEAAPDPPLTPRQLRQYGIMLEVFANAVLVCWLLLWPG